MNLITVIVALIVVGTLVYFSYPPLGLLMGVAAIASVVWTVIASLESWPVGEQPGENSNCRSNSGLGVGRFGHIHDRLYRHLFTDRVVRHEGRGR